MELDKNQHSVYSINYHLVMVIKYRRKVISDEISGYLRAMFERIGITFWTKSYCLISTGGVSIDVIKQYIERQGQK